MCPEGGWILSHGGSGENGWSGEERTVALLQVAVKSEEELDGTVRIKRKAISELCVEENFLEKKKSSKKKEYPQAKWAD